MSDKHNGKTSLDERLAEVYDQYFKDGKLEVASYQTDKVCMALIVSGKEPDMECVPTKNLGSMCGNMTIMPRYCAFLDTNNNPDIDKYLEANGWGEPYTRFGETVKAQSGWCEYPLFQFNAEKLKGLDPKGCEEYEAGYVPAFSKIQNKMNEAMFGGMFEDEDDDDLDFENDDIQDDGTGLGE